MSDPRRGLRQELRDRRRLIDAPRRIAGAAQLARQLLSLPFAPTHGHVAGYWAMDGEIALNAWQLRLPTTVTYCLPVLAGEVLRFAPWRPGAALTSNRYGIPEPDIAIEATLPAEAMDLVATPLVGFDAQGHRLGMGGGWYDRSFAFRRGQGPAPWLVGVGFSVQQVDHLVNEPWDVAVDAICTEATTLFPGTATA